MKMLAIKPWITWKDWTITAVCPDDRIPGSYCALVRKPKDNSLPGLTTGEMHIMITPTMNNFREMGITLELLEALYGEQVAINDKEHPMHKPYIYEAIF